MSRKSTSNESLSTNTESTRTRSYSSTSSFEIEEKRKLSNSQILNAPCKGFLKEKEKGKLGLDIWSKSYFLLFDQIIYKLTNNSDAEIKNSFSIFQTKVVDYDKASGRSNCFSIFFQDGKQKIFTTETSLEKEKWMKEIGRNSGTTENVTHESILNSINDAGVGSDKKGIIKAVNKKAIELFGYSSKEDLLEKNVSILMAESLRKPHDELMEKYTETGRKSLIGNVRTVTGRHSNGSLFQVEISLGETTDENMKFIAIFRPIKKIEKKTQEMNEKPMTPSYSEIHNLKKELDKQLELYGQKLDEITIEEFEKLKIFVTKKVELNIKRKEEIDELGKELENLKKKSKILKSELDSIKQEEIPTMLDFLKNERTNQKLLEVFSQMKGGESIRFWNEVEIFKKSKMNLIEKAKFIYDTFLTQKNKLVVDEKLLLDVEKQLDNPRNDLFDLIQNVIFERMENFIYKFFCSTPEGKEAIEYLQME